MEDGEKINVNYFIKKCYFTGKRPYIGALFVLFLCTAHLLMLIDADDITKLRK